MSSDYYENVEHVIHVTTEIEKGCQLCESTDIFGDFTKSVNHYIKEHGYKILHIGPETKTGSSGNPVSYTVAVLGKERSKKSASELVKVVA